LNSKLLTRSLQQSRDEKDVGLYKVCVPRHWQRGAAGQPYEERRGLGCPRPDTAGSSWLQPIQHRARLNPTAEMVAPWGNLFKKRQKHWTER